MIEIIYEDRELLVCIKQPDTLSEKSDDEKSLPCIIEKEYLEKGISLSLFTIHRLDREVRGLMVYAKTADAAKKLSASVTNGDFEKVYLAVTEKALEESEGVLRDLLFKDSKKNKSYVVDRERKGVKSASLEYKLLSSTDERHLYRIKLHTGRTHQIRVQLSSRACPIVGDRKYGSRSNGDMLLCSHKIGFTHPKTKKRMEFSYSPSEIIAPFGIESL